jgi:hypothetical protein
MANWSTLKAAIANVIKTNGNQEITGAVLQNTLNSIVSAVGENATFAGIATPSTNPGAPDGNVFYIASESGTYSNFGGIVNNGECLILKKNEDSWVSIETGIITNKKLSNLLGLVIDTSTFVNGQWTGNGEGLSSNNNSSYLRNSGPIPISGNTNNIISLYSNTGQKKRIADMGLVLKFRNKSKQDVSFSYVQSGQYIQLSAEASELYIHGTTENINNINGFSFFGFIFINSLMQDIAQNTQDIAQNTQDIEALNNMLVGGSVNYTTGAQLGVYPNHAYVGSTLGDNPISNAANSALGRIDVSDIPDNTLIYITKGGENIYDGIVFKFFNSSGNQVNATTGGSSSEKNRGRLKPNGAVVLGLHISNTYIKGDAKTYMSDFHINNVPNKQQGFDVRITENEKDIAQNMQDIEALNNTVTELQDDFENISVSDYKTTLKILFIGSSFGVDTVREVGNICASFGKNVILGNAYIGAATLDVFLKRFQGNKGVTYYKWKYQATTWEQYNGTTGKWSSEPDSDITDEGEPAPANDTVLMDWLLADEAWDFIIMQNGAYQSPYEDQSSFWEKGEDGQITRNIVQELIDLCKKACLYSNPVFCMNMTWAFSIYHTISESHGPNGADDDHWLSYGNNQKERQLGMWRNIAKNYKDCISNCPDVKFIIPSGTAVQNARANSTLRQSTIYTKATPAPPTISQAETITDLDNISSTYAFMDNSTNWRNKTDFTRDSIHANFGITRYIIAATLFQTFIAKVLNLDIADCTYRIAQGTGDYREQLCTPVTDDNFSDIITCVKNAINNPYTIS